MKTAACPVFCLVVLFGTESIACELAVFEQTADDSPHGVSLAGAERNDEGVGYCQLEGMSRPWCPYPQVARLSDPNLGPNEADNFQCVAPPE